MERAILLRLIRTKLDGLERAVFRGTVMLILGVVLQCSASGCTRQTVESSFVPGLGEIMTLTQMRHAKLWFAGEAGNWELVEYELDELNEGLDDAAKFHPTHKDVELPIPALIDKIMASPIKQLQEAAEAKDTGLFIKRFDELTDACNQCHQATDFGFNVVTRPTANPYSNQVFGPAH
jgi:hypothetical protein